MNKREELRRAYMRIDELRPKIEELQAELAEAKLNTEAVAQARDEAIGRVEKMAESYRELAEKYDALKARTPQHAALMDPDCPMPHAAYVEGYRKWGQGQPERVVPHAGYVEGYRKRGERDRIALEMARHTAKFAKPRRELWDDMPWSPIKGGR